MSSSGIVLQEEGLLSVHKCINETVCAHLISTSPRGLDQTLVHLVKLLTNCPKYMSKQTFYNNCYDINKLKSTKTKIM